MYRQLVMIRHGESVWNRENLFTGWTDVDLSETGREEARQGGTLLKEAGFHFDVCYTSYLRRAIHTANCVLEQMDEEWIPVVKTWKLNERHYGALQGLNKAETAERYGEAQVKIWRRSFDVRPPALEASDERNPALQPMYQGIAVSELPLAESLKDTIARVCGARQLPARAGDVSGPYPGKRDNRAEYPHRHSAGIRPGRGPACSEAPLSGRCSGHTGQNAGRKKPGHKAGLRQPCKKEENHALHPEIDRRRHLGGRQ